MAVTMTLLAAIQNNNADAVRAALQAKVNPDERDPATGLTALMSAAGRGQVDIVRMLLKAGGDVHAVDSGAGATALHKACQGGSFPCFELLVDAGAFIDAQCVSTGHTALFEAIWFKQTKIATYLLEHGAGLKIDTHYGFTLDQHLAYAKSVNASVAAEFHKLEQIEAAIQARRDRDASAVGSQQLMQAVDQGNTARVQELLAQRVTVDERYPILNGFNDHHTPLLVACRDGHTEIAQLLLAAGAEVNATEPTFGAVPLHKAVYNGHADITNLLVKQRGVNINFQGYTNGYTPLLDSIWHGFQECASILIEAGARLDLCGHDGKSPLDLSEAVFGKDHTITTSIRRRLTAN